MMQTLTSLLLTGAAMAAPTSLRGLRGSWLEDHVLHPDLQVHAMSSVAYAIHEMLPQGEYDGMMFAGGMKINGTTTWVARVCTGACKVLPLDSRVIMGTVKPGRSEWTWASGAEVPVHHSNKGATSGPEDPRLDAVEGKRFFLANVNVDRDTLRCPLVRRQVFVPVDSHAGAQQCVIDVDEQNFDECQDQKNWAPLVPKGSKTPFFVYSLVPFQVMSLDRQSCKANMVKPGGVRKPEFSDVRSSTRYHHGLDVEEGSIYWSVGHTPPMEYKSVLTAVLAKHAGQKFDFELLGTSCGFQIPGMLAEDQLFSYPNSILDFNGDADLADVTFHVDDTLNKVATLRGIKVWLQKAYRHWKEGGSFRCSRDFTGLARFLSNATNGTNASTTSPKSTKSPMVVTTSTTSTVMVTTSTTSTVMVTTSTTSTTMVSTSTTSMMVTTSMTSSMSAEAGEDQAIVTAAGTATLEVENATQFCADPATTQGFAGALASSVGVDSADVNATCVVGSMPPVRRLLANDTQVVTFEYVITIRVTAGVAAASLQTIQSAMALVEGDALATVIVAKILEIDPDATYTVKVTAFAVPEVEMTDLSGRPLPTRPPRSSTEPTSGSSTSASDDESTTTAEDTSKARADENAAFSYQRLPAMAGFLATALLVFGA